MCCVSGSGYWERITIRWWSRRFFQAIWLWPAIMAANVPRSIRDKEARKVLNLLLIHLKRAIAAFGIYRREAFGGRFVALACGLNTGESAHLAFRLY